MSDPRIGRLLMASLHQSISDALPDRLDFYEHWLRPAEGGELRVSMASLGAVLSFLRREGQPVYDEVMTRAGRYAAEWTVNSRPALERQLARRMPAAIRARLAMRISRKLVRATYGASKTTTRIRRRSASVAIQDSVFCNLRAPAAAPMCAFYAAAVERLLALLRVSAVVEVSTCHAQGASACGLLVTVGDSRIEATSAEAA